MEPFRTELAHALDALVAASRATVTETRTSLAVYQLDGAAAADLVVRLEPAGFTLTQLADEGGPLRASALDATSVGIELVATKPVTADHIRSVLTVAGFQAVLERAPAEPIIWVHNLDRRIATATTCYRPWGDDGVFEPEAEPADPARVARVLGAGSTPEPIGRWLLRDPETDLAGPVLAPWRERATMALARALAQEIERDDRLLFRGPPPTRFRAEGVARTELSTHAALQRAAGWVYEQPRELENRHGLLAAEVARTALRDGDLADLASIMPGALEGARIAYGFGVSQQSRDALKSLSDLRKAVADETTKLGDATRTLAAAVTTSAVGNIGIVVARLTVPKTATFIGPAAVVIGVALALYVLTVIGTGWHFLAIQRDLRSAWREQLYRFLGDEDYARMVTIPVGRAETGFVIAAWASLAVTGLMLIAVLLVVALTP